MLNESQNSNISFEIDGNAVVPKISENTFTDVGSASGVKTFKSLDEAFGDIKMQLETFDRTNK